VHATDQLSVRVDDLAEIDRAMAHVRAYTPKALLGAEVTGVEDRLPDADVVTLRTDAVRVVIRPSGTEPKLKAYLEVIEPVTGASALEQARTAAKNHLAAVRGEVEGLLSAAR
jgi:phosphomannomutase